jgi:hypothetical protein
MSRWICVLFTTAALLVNCGGAATDDVSEEAIAGPSETQQAWCSGDLCGCYEPRCPDVCPPPDEGGLACLASCRRAQKQCSIACCRPY